MINIYQLNWQGKNSLYTRRNSGSNLKRTMTRWKIQKGLEREAKNTRPECLSGLDESQEFLVRSRTVMRLGNSLLLLYFLDIFFSSFLLSVPINKQKSNILLTTQLIFMLIIRYEKSTCDYKWCWLSIVNLFMLNIRLDDPKINNDHT